MSTLGEPISKIIETKTKNPFKEAQSLLDGEQSKSHLRQLISKMMMPKPSDRPTPDLILKMPFVKDAPSLTSEQKIIFHRLGEATEHYENLYASIGLNLN